MKRAQRLRAADTAAVTEAAADLEAVEAGLAEAGVDPAEVREEAEAATAVEIPAADGAAENPGSFCR